MRKTIFPIIFLFAQQLIAQNFTIIGLPDTQCLVDVSGGNPEIFNAQTQWIVTNKDNLNIVYVAHVGDIVEHGGEDQEWQRADIALSFLEDPSTTNLNDGISYGLAVGNHDDDNDNTEKFNEYFGVSRFSNRSYYGGHYGDNNDNHYDLFSASGIDFLVMYFRIDKEQQPDAPVLIWAEGIIQTYSHRRVLIVSHRIIDTGNPAPFADGQGGVLYNVFKVYPNVFLMLCGHYKGEGRREDIYEGNTIHTLMADFQCTSNDGHLRIMEFNPDLGTIDVKTYSPYDDAYKTGSNSQFTLYSDFSSLPVELAFFTGALNGNNIELRWRTETEVNNYGFFIERSTGNLDWLTLGFIEGNGNSNSPNYYTFNDSEIYESGKYKYRLRQTDNDGTFEYSDVVTVTVGVPVLYSLGQNYPNPFNPETRIDYTLPEQQNVTLRVYNMLGEMVKELVNEIKPAGSYAVTFDGSDLPSGVYVYRIQAEGFSENKKMTILK